MDPRHATSFPEGFFARGDETDDADFYAFDRFVTHIDDGAIGAIGELYEELQLADPGSGPVLDSARRGFRIFRPGPIGLSSPA